MQQYLDLLQHIKANGRVKTDRTGTGTTSVFGYQMRFNLQGGFPLLTTKKIHFKSVVHELLWFLKGDTNIKYLVDHGVSIWNDWPYKSYLQTTMTSLIGRNDAWCNKRINDEGERCYSYFTEAEFIDRIRTDREFSSCFGDLGPVYGKQWRSWPDGNGFSIDQLANVIKQLKTTPDSRRMIVTAWNPAEVDQMALPACHCLFQFYTIPLTTQERMALFFNAHPTWAMSPEETFFDGHNIPKFRLSCQLYQRSADVFLGVPFNIASYALLTMLMARECNMVPDEFIWTGGDTHLYLNHLEQVDTQLGRVPLSPPRLVITADQDVSLFDLTYADFKLEEYLSYPAIKAPVAV